MTQHRIFIIGSSVFADGLVAALRRVDTVHIVGSAPSLEVANARLSQDALDAIILVGTTHEDSGADFGKLVARFPILPIIWTILSVGKVRVTTSHCVEARMPDLLKAITDLPKSR